MKRRWFDNFKSEKNILNISLFIHEICHVEVSLKSKNGNKRSIPNNNP